MPQITIQAVTEPGLLIACHSQEQVTIYVSKTSNEAIEMKTKQNKTRYPGWNFVKKTGFSILAVQRESKKQGPCVSHVIPTRIAIKKMQPFSSRIAALVQVFLNFPFQWPPSVLASSINYGQGISAQYQTPVCHLLSTSILALLFPSF